MLKILIPVDSSRNCQFAVQHVIKEFVNNRAMEIHLLNVQAPFSADIARFVSRKSLHDFHRDEAEKALDPIKQMLDRFSIPYSVHAEVGAKAKIITDAARRLRCPMPSRGQVQHAAGRRSVGVWGELMDQLVDFAAYEGALREGRAVVMVHVEGDLPKAAAHLTLRNHGGHFINYYGRFATEELDMWRGTEPDISDYLRR